MNEDRHIKQVLFRNTILFFVVFALIFATLGIFTYGTVKDTMYKSADVQLNSIKEGYPLASAETLELADAVDLTANSAGDSFGSDTPAADASISGEAGSTATITTQAIEASVQDNPQTIFVFRDADGSMGDVLNLYPGYLTFVQDLPFDPNKIDSIYDIELNGHYYRGVSRTLEIGESVGSYAIDTNAVADGSTIDTPTQQAEWRYLQMVVNVDAEIAMLEQFRQTLIIALIIALVVCAAASYLLSRKTTRPIVHAWKKQTEFVQNASHELRTPLTVIHATQELLLEKPHDKIIDHFEDISLTLDETGRLSKLAEELMMLTSLDSGVLTFSKENVALDQLIEDTAILFDDYALAQEKSLILDLQYEKSIDADPDRIRQVLNALLSNAFKYTEAGDSVTICTREDGQRAIISIADTGIGVTAEDKMRLFDRFYRADQARTRTKEGVGLGLSIAQSIVEALGGTIRIDDNKPKGALAVVTLPAKN